MEAEEPWPSGAVALREYFESIFVEQRRALAVAEQEREKAASALREGLSERIASGDKQLEAHINAQIESVRLAQIAAKQLSDQRSESAEKAVDKAFAASKELADKHNDLLAQHDRDREKFATKTDLGYERESMKTLIGTIDTRVATSEKNIQGGVSRETYDERHEALIQRVAAIETSSAQNAGQREGVGLSTRNLVTGLTLVFSLIIVIFTVLAANGSL